MRAVRIPIEIELMRWFMGQMFAIEWTLKLGKFGRDLLLHSTV